IMVESNPLNNTLQLSGPALISGNDSTQTWGDWVSENPTRLFDDAAWADSLSIPYTPYVVAVCPNYQASMLPISDYATMENALLQQVCIPLTTGRDAALSQFMLERSCGSSTVALTWILTNQGTELLESCIFQSENLVDSPTFTWTGSLPSFASDTITWEAQTLVNDNPVHVFQWEADANALNDTLTGISVVGLAMHQVQLELNIDGFPEEVSWDIRNENDSVIFSGGDYAVPYQYINQILNLPVDGCYRFTLYDEAGDGLHGSQWGGFDGFCYLRSLDDDDLSVTSILYAYDGSYNFINAWNTPASQSVAFEVGSALRVENLQVEVNVSLFPNPANEQLQVRLSNIPWGKGDWRIVDLQGQVHQSGA
ncbi:MAG: hypothetical protein ACKO66_11675, partial [Flavobacteriales bacterium]